MKKLLLSAATALLATAAVCAQDLPVIYKVGDRITSADQFVSGQYVVTVATDDNSVPTSGMYRRSGEQYIGIFGQAYENVAEVGNKGIPYFFDHAYVWNIVVNDEGLFTLQTVVDNKYFSCKGRGATNGDNFDGSARFTPLATTGDDGTTPLTTPALFKLSNDLTEDSPKSHIQLTNALFNNNQGLHGHPSLTTDGVQNNPPAGTNKQFSYFGSVEGGTVGGVTFAFNPVRLAEADDFVDVEVTFPEFGGTPMVKTVKCLKDANATPFINEVIESFGGLENAVIKSAGDNAEDLIATADNAAFTVEGDWICDFEPYEVYRVVVDPLIEKTSAMRYMIEAETIRVQLDDKEASVARIVPERLWYFEPVENEPFNFYLRTLYDQDKGVYFPEPYADGVDAQLSKDPTKLELVSKADLIQEGVTYPQFFLKIAGSENFYLNDYRGVGNTAGTLQLYQNPSDTDAGSLFRLYPISAAEKAQIGLTDDDGDAMATNPTFIEKVNEWNAQNVRAALRRIDFYSKSDLIGNDPGQINNPDGNLVEKIAEAQEVAKQLDNGEEVEAGLQSELTAALDWREFIVNPIIPGHFYRFENFKSNKYISSTNYNSSSYMDLTTDADRSNTVFYYMEQDGEKMLVSFDDGRVMNKCVRNDTPWTPVLSNHEKAAKGIEFITKDAATFVIHVSGNVDSDNAAEHRHLYGAGNTSDKTKDFVNLWGGSDDDNTRWYVHEIDKLPITFYNIINNETDEYDDDGWASVYAPVALEVPANEHITAYTGTFVQNVNTENGDLQHILATEIPANEDGKVIIPAGQAALLFYDGQSDVEEDPDFNPALMPQRQNITYVYLPIVYDYEGKLAEKGNLTGSYLAFSKESDKKYYTLHASYNNYFRPLSSYQDGYFDYVPGFKANIPMTADGEEYYQVSPFDPNSIVPEVKDNKGTEGLEIEKVGEQYKVTVTIDSQEDFKVYFKHTAAAAEENAPASVRRRAEGTLEAGQKEGYDPADKVGIEHSFVVNGPGTVEYYAYHAGKNVTGAVRSFDVTKDGEVATTGIKSVLVNMNGKQVIFDLQGRRMGAPVKGVSIINGKKTYVK